MEQLYKICVAKETTYTSLSKAESKLIVDYNTIEKPMLMETILAVKAHHTWSDKII